MSIIGWLHPTRRTPRLAPSPVARGHSAGSSSRGNDASKRPLTVATTAVGAAGRAAPEQTGVTGALMAP
jgi:hypothetical protein